MGWQPRWCAAGFASPPCRLSLATPRRKRRGSMSINPHWMWPRSIRMRSAGIGHRRSIRRTELGRFERAIALLGVSAIALAVLAGCANGQANEERIAETREATRAAVLPSVHETRIVGEFFPPTGTPVATSTAL